MIAVGSNGSAQRIPTQRAQNNRGPVRLNKRGKLWLKIVGIGLIFVAGIVLGNKSALDSPEGHRPPATVLAQLNWAESHSKTTCHAEYMVHTPAVPGAAASKADNGPEGWDVICGSDKTVTDFNDGFTESKVDDCQQGDAKACAWLKTTKH